MTFMETTVEISEDMMETSPEEHMGEENTEPDPCAGHAAERDSRFRGREADRRRDRPQHHYSPGRAE